MESTIRWRAGGRERQGMPAQQLRCSTLGKGEGGWGGSGPGAGEARLLGQIPGPRAQPSSCPSSSGSTESQGSLDGGGEQRWSFPRRPGHLLDSQLVLLTL